MSTPLTIGERKLRASIAAHAAHAKHGSQKMTAAMREASNFTRIADEIDAERQLPPDELAKRVEHARKSHMKSLSLKASKARRLKALKRRNQIIESSS